MDFRKNRFLKPIVSYYHQFINYSFSYFLFWKTISVLPFSSSRLNES